MVRVEVTEEFTLGDFKALKDITRRNVNQEGKLFVGDRFTCDEKMADYLTGGNQYKKVVVKVIEVLPKEDISPKDTKTESENIIPLGDSNLKEIAKQVNKSVKKSKKSKR